MTIQLELRSEPVENSDEFVEPFFQQFKSRPLAIQLNEHVRKTYHFPTFYRDVELSMAVFLCSWEKAERLMPAANVRPVHMGRGKTFIVFTCYNYQCVNEMVGYHEVGMSIPVIEDSRHSVPILPVLFGHRFPNFGYHIFSMPVTSLESQRRGDEIWGLPKVVQEIECKNEGPWNTCTIKEKTGETYLTLKVPTSGKRKNKEQSARIISKKENDLLHSQTAFRGAFTERKYVQQLWRPLVCSEEYLTIGDTSSGRILRELEIDPHPFQLSFGERVTSMFDLPMESGEWNGV